MSSDPGKAVMPFGRDKGKTFDEIARTDKGLKDLDRLKGKDWVRQEFKAKLDAYLNTPAMVLELRRAMGDD